jgi:hypothetical protein
MKCKRCQTEVVENAKYCHNCGIVITTKLLFITKEMGEENIIAELLDKMSKLEERLKKLEEKNVNATTTTPWVIYNGSGTTTPGGTLPGVIPMTTPLMPQTTPGIIYGGSTGTPADYNYSISSMSTYQNLGSSGTFSVSSSPDSSLNINLISNRKG